VSSTLFGYVGYLTTPTPTIVAVFRGTENVKGWISDGNVIQEAFPYCAGCSVHQGFWNAYKGGAPQVYELIDEAVAKCGEACPVIFTGHSLGAALATLASFDVSVRNSSLNISLFNFGSPRVGNPQFASALVSKLFSQTYRYTHSRDLVPMVPYQAENYHHITEEIWQDPNGAYHYCSTTNGEDPNCIDSVTVANPLDHATYLGQNCLAGIVHLCFYDEP